MGQCIAHGSYSEESHFRMVQHEYAGTDCEDRRQGYWEVLEIWDPPPGHARFVAHQHWNDTGSTVYEYRTLETAKKGYRSLLSQSQPVPPQDIAGFLRLFVYEHEKPWFYRPMTQL